MSILDLIPRSQPSIRARALLAALSLMLGNAVLAQTTVLSKGSFEVTTFDIEAAAQRLPKESRSASLSRLDNLVRLVEDLLVRRTLADEAERAGVADEPVAKALIRQSRERILSDVQLIDISVAARPDDALLSNYAQDLYRANPERFKTPGQSRARHILVAATEPDARMRAEALLSRVKAGESFEAIAKEHSADPGSAAKGGDLGFFSTGKMVKPFDDAVAALKQPGDLSDIVETQFGFHIIRLEERRPEGVRPFQEVREELETEIIVRAQREARQARGAAILKDAKMDMAALEALARKYANP